MSYGHDELPSGGEVIGKGIKWGLIAVLIVFVVAMVATGAYIEIYRVWAPVKEEARREVFEQTPSYVLGKNTYIARLRAQYEAAEDERKQSLRQLVLEEAATIDESNLSSGNRAFIRTLR